MLQRSCRFATLFREKVAVEAGYFLRLTKRREPGFRLAFIGFCGIIRQRTDYLIECASVKDNFLKFVTVINKRTYAQENPRRTRRRFLAGHHAAAPGLHRGAARIYYI